jgi:hypothetical protein
MVDSEMISPRLYMPFIIRHSFDANFQPYLGYDLSSLVGSYEYLKAGRPLVSMPTLLPIPDGRPDASAQENGLKFLQRKLHGGQTMRTRTGALSEMLCRLGAFVHPQHPFATEMVAECMATLLATDNERKSMLVAYVAEPRLAIAAASAWASESYFVNELAPALQYALISGAVSQGARGELVAQIIWLLAFDQAAILARKSVGECVDLEQVLEQLIPAHQTVDLSLAIPKHLRGAQIACCQIVNVASKFNSRIHVQAAERHCGISFCEGQTGVDLGFPLFTKNRAIVLAQTKNRADLQSPGEQVRAACFKMQPKVAFVGGNLGPEEVQAFQNNCVRVFMQVGARTAMAAIDADESSLAPTLQIFGLGSRCLSPGVQKSLEVLLNGRLNLQNFAKYQYSVRDPNVPFPGLDSLVSGKAVAPWPFINDGKDSDQVISSEEVDHGTRTNNHRSEICAAANEVTVKRLQEICSHHGLSKKGTKAVLLKRIFDELPPAPHKIAAT